MANGITQLLHQTKRAKRLFPDEPLETLCRRTLKGDEADARDGHHPANIPRIAGQGVSNSDI